VLHRPEQVEHGIKEIFGIAEAQTEPVVEPRRQALQRANPVPEIDSDATLLCPGGERTQTLRRLQPRKLCAIDVAIDAPLDQFTQPPRQDRVHLNALRAEAFGPAVGRLRGSRRQIRVANLRFSHRYAREVGLSIGRHLVQVGFDFRGMFRPDGS
jgi:hypothetical protein